MFEESYRIKAWGLGAVERGAAFYPTAAMSPAGRGAKRPRPDLQLLRRCYDKHKVVKHVL